MLKQLAKIANKLDDIGLTKEADVLDRIIVMAQMQEFDEQPTDKLEFVQDIYLDKEPSLDREKLKEAFIDHVQRSFIGEFGEIDGDSATLEWIQNPESDYSNPHYMLSYIVLSIGEEPREESVQFYPVRRGFSSKNYIVSMRDKEGNNHYFYSEY